MSTTKRLLVSGVSAAVLVVAVCGVLVVFPFPPIGRVLVAAGFPLAYVIGALLPHSILAAVAPEGGPDAVGWIFALSTLITWFAILFTVCFIAIGRMRSNHRIEADTYSAQLRTPSASFGTLERTCETHGNSSLNSLGSN